MRTLQVVDEKARGACRPGAGNIGPAEVARRRTFGLIQARLRFCEAFGIVGLRNAGPPGGEEPVTMNMARRADRPGWRSGSSSGLAWSAAPRASRWR